MTLRDPKFIYFDLGNVLLFFSHRRAASQMAALAGIPEDLAWKTVFESRLEDDYEAGRISSREFYHHFCQVTRSQPDYEQLLHAASDIFDVNASIIPLVAHLSRARYPLGILSNTNEAHWRLVRDGRYSLIQDFFRVVVLSFEVGVMKPHPAIYIEAAARAKVSPHEIFYCDDRQENVAGAVEAGFDAVLFENTRQLAQELRRRKVRWNY